MKKVVYVGCSLTQAPPEFREAVEALKKRLEKDKVCIVLKFKGLSDKNIPYDVYVHDINKCVRKCDLLVAICDFPSIGLGYEMGTQGEARRRPILAVAHKDALISKLILDTRTPGYEFKRYNNLVDDVYRMIVTKLNSLDGTRPKYRR
ncbi:MAG: hypothetical protein ACOYL8_04160 [Patescibacteria group bacterium]